MGIQTRIEQPQRAAERRAKTRRETQKSYAGQERRKHERREAVDFSIID